jgi:general secretion pathway protein J
MKAQGGREISRIQRIAGFTLFEALVSVALMSAIVGSLGAMIGQWLPNWQRGFDRVQRIDLLDLGLQRLVSDIDTAEFITTNNASKTPIFLGERKSVTLVRTATSPGTIQHLEVVRYAETVDERGFALVRTHAAFKLLNPHLPIEAQLKFIEPVVLVRAPYRVSFAYAGPDRVWRDSWRDELLLPSAARIEVRDAATGKVLPVSTAALLHADLPTECATQPSAQQCVDGMRASAARPHNRQGIEPTARAFINEFGNVN